MDKYVYKHVDLTYKHIMIPLTLVIVVMVVVVVVVVAVVVVAVQSVISTCWENCHQTRSAERWLFVS